MRGDAGEFEQQILFLRGRRGGPHLSRDVKRSDQPVILLCSDVSDAGPCPVPADEIAAAVRERAPRVRVLTVARLCSGPAGLVTALRSLHARRAVVGCRHGAARRGEISALLRRAGTPWPGISVVDLMPGGHPGPPLVARQSAARLRAAAAQVALADLDTPVRERADGAARLFSRRSLFHPAAIAGGPVACWAEGRCGSGENCRACASACPYGALHLTPAGVTVDTAACTGCGALTEPVQLREPEASAQVLARLAVRAGDVAG